MHPLGGWEEIQLFIGILHSMKMKKCKKKRKPEKQFLSINGKDMRRSHGKMENFVTVLERTELNLEKL